MAHRRRTSRTTELYRLAQDTFRRLLLTDLSGNSWTSQAILKLSARTHAATAQPRYRTTKGQDYRAEELWRAPLLIPKMVQAETWLHN